jgi:uncharacterized protein (DUF2236 family)
MSEDVGGAPFVRPGSVVRRIWGDGDMIILIFAGSAAEFALNRAIDWLFFTGRLPDDPIGRVFTTAAYARDIVFADATTAQRTLDRIRAGHQAVERKRGQTIPDWAHRDVLYMLIDYSERAHEALAGPLSTEQKADLYDVFLRVGSGLRIPDLPASYAQWTIDRDVHLRRDLIHGDLTDELYARYRKHLGPFQYELLLRIQSVLVPDHVREQLRLGRSEWMRPLLRLYPILGRAGLRSLIQRLLVPAQHLAAIRGLDYARPLGGATAG